MTQSRRALDAPAYGAMLAITALWGFQHVAAKWIAEDVSLLAQGAIRSLIATVLLLAWARARGVALWQHDGTLRPGLAAGLLFGIEFVFIYGGLAHTNASRMSVFVNLAPVLAALGLHFAVHLERLSPAQGVGIALAFCGIVVAFAEGFATEQSTWRGDLCGILAAVFWAATIVLVRATPLAVCPPSKTLLYQLGAAAVVLAAASALLGEKGVTAVNSAVLVSLFYQSVVIGFASLLAWFWLLTRYHASRLAVLSFLTPMFGILWGVVFLGEPLTGAFLLGSLLVAAGVALVNLRR